VSAEGPLLAGIDLGTTSIKAGVYTASGASLAQASVRTPTYYPQPGWAYHRAEELWQCTAQVLRAVTSRVDAGRIAGVAVASMGEAGVPLDAHGTPLYDVIAWFDNRTVPQVERLQRALGDERLFEITGVPPRPIFGVFKLMWLAEHAPDVLARAATWLNAGDYVAYRLSGVPATDHSMASRMLLMDLRRRAWSEEILGAAGLRRSLLAPLVPSGTRLGPVTAEAARETGLPQTVQVAAGGHDHDCGALAVGVVDPGDVLDSLGTAEAIFLPLERPLSGVEVGQLGYAQGAHVVPGRFYVHGGLYTSGASVEWLRDVVGRDGDVATLIAEAAQVPPGSLGTYFLPHLRLANPPRRDLDARGAFIGLTADATRGVLFRAVLEGLAYESRLSLETLLDAPGVAPMRRFVAIGGSTRNRLFMQIKASVLDQTVAVADVEEATGLGAAVLGGLGAGVYEDVGAATRALRVPVTDVAPDGAQVGQYDERYRRAYLRLYPALRELHHAISALER
jgi:xylulokinase